MRNLRSNKGFTLIELMIVVVIIGILAAIAIPNFIAMQDRAKEGSTKANMHTVQLAAEDFAVLNDGTYSTTQASLVVPAGFKNPFNSSATALEDVSWGANPTATAGITSYADSSSLGYEIKGQGKTGPLTLVLTTGM